MTKLDRFLELFHDGRESEYEKILQVFNTTRNFLKIVAKVYYDPTKTEDPENNNIMYLNPDTSVRIDSDEARKIYVKRPHTISGFTMKYTITYKQTGTSDVILE